MKILKTAVAVALVGFLAVPALAGVTGAEGGTKSITTTTQKSYTDNVVDKHVTNRTSSTIDRGVVRHIKTWVGGRADGKGLGSLINPLLNWLDGGADPGPGWRDSYEYVQQTGLGPFGTLPNGRYALWGDAIDNSWSSTSTSSSESGPVYVGETYVKTTSTRDTNSSPDYIVVGDADALEGAYVAQGHVDQHTTITDHYTKDYINTITTNIHTTNYYEVIERGSVSPIVLDLDGDGKLQASAGKWQPHESSFDKTRVALFDFNANGFPVLTEWVGPQDGLLLRSHADGSVDGSCLFGTFGGFANGYEALKALDVDGNGNLEGSELQGLKVWQDANGNAIIDAGELLSLDELGITSISTNHDSLRGTFVRNGKTARTFDWWPSVIELRKKDMNRNA
ncbi:MAG: hypothetical protein ACOX9B_13175 [Candidatus Xenobium sp.]|nr:hypothetical protein [Burkholderiales bacterium]